MKIPVSKKIILPIITIILLWVVFDDIDFRKLVAELKNIDVKYIILIVMSIITSLSFRGLCFKQLIKKTINIPAVDSALICITSAALNIVLPARTGDMFRAYHIGKKYDVGKVKVFGTVMFERIWDLFIICSMMLAGTMLYNKNELTVRMCIIAFAIISASFVFAVMSYKYINIPAVFSKITALTDKLPLADFTRKIAGFMERVLTSFCSGFEALDSPKNIFRALLSLAFVWFFECMSYYITIMAFHLDLHFSVTIFIACFIVFAGLIPSVSIFLGPTQIAVITAFALYHVDKETALAVSFVEQGLVTVVTLVIAVLYLAKNRISYKNLRENT